MPTLRLYVYNVCPAKFPLYTALHQLQTTTTAVRQPACLCMLSSTATMPFDGCQAVLVTLTYAGDKVDVGLRVGQAEPAALHGLAVGRLLRARLGGGGRVHGQLAAHEVGAVQQLARPGRALLALKLHEAEAVQLACAQHTRPPSP